MTQFGSTGTSITDSQNVFAQTSGSNQPSYLLYQNSDYGFSIQYPDNWSYNQNVLQNNIGVITFTPNDNSGNVAFQVIFIKDDTNYRGLQGQAYLNTMTSDLSNTCSTSSFENSGYQCSDFKLLYSKVESYHDGPAYSVAYSWTEKAKNGNVYSMYTAVQWIPDGNNRWVLDGIGTADKFSQYKDVTSHMVDSFKLDNYKPPTSQTTESQATQTTSNSVQQNIPNWIRNNAKWWAEGSISDSDFVKGIQYLIQQDIIIVPSTQATTNPSQTIPSWIKNNAQWWAGGQIADSDFVKGLQYLVQNGIVTVHTEQSIQPQSYGGYNSWEDYCQATYGTSYHYDSSKDKCIQSYGGYNSWEDYCQAKYGSSSHYDSSQYKCIKQSTGSGTQGGGDSTSSGGTQSGSTTARDLTGHYQGHIQGSFTTDYYGKKGLEHLNCQYSGTVFIYLAQRGNNPDLVDGDVQTTGSITGDQDCQYFPGALFQGSLSATVFGSGFSGKVGTLDVNAQFTTDLLRGTFSGDIGVISTQGEFTASRVK